MHQKIKSHRLKNLKFSIGLKKINLDFANLLKQWQWNHSNCMIEITGLSEELKKEVGNLKFLMATINTKEDTIQIQI